MAQSVLVTGGAGFIGSHLVDRLLAAGDRVRVVDALVSQVHGPAAEQPQFLSPEAEFIRADLCEVDHWDDILAGIDSVVHLASEVGVGQSMYQIDRYIRANSLGTAVLLQALLARRGEIAKLVVASSMSIYGEGAYECLACGRVQPRLRSARQLQDHEWEMTCPLCRRPVQPVPTREDKPLDPSSVYATSKRDQEELFITFGRAYDIPCVALRFFNVYGPRQSLTNPYTGAAAIFSSRILNGKSPLIFEDGRQSRDLIHVSDIVQGIVLALRSERVRSEVLNVGTGRSLSIGDLAHALIREIGADMEPQIVQQFREGDIRHCYADISRIQQVLGFVPTVAFEDGITDLVAWVQGQTAVDRVDAAYGELLAQGLAR
jgi:dTDP-L-rhamnose 4-epimerase